jgi:sortase A
MKLLRRFRFLIVLMLAGGVCLTARAAYLHAKAALAGVLIRDAWEENVQTGETRRPWPWADTHPVARLRIPRLGYDEIVLEGATLRTLAFGPARLRSGVAFGEPGNLVLAGHRTSWFRRLEAVRPGDTIELEWRDPRRRGLRGKTYVIEELRVVTPGDIALLAPTNHDALTLVTCYPFGRGPSSPLRFIVRAAPAVTALSTGYSAKKRLPAQDWPR